MIVIVFLLQRLASDALDSLPRQVTPSVFVKHPTTQYDRRLSRELQLEEPQPSLRDGGRRVEK